MGMTIEESMLYMELYKRKLIDSVSDLEKDIEAYDVAIDTMRKYQKIQEPQAYKWCTDCREYDQEKHCCHRWSKVIRDTVEEMKQEPKTGHWKLVQRGKFIDVCCSNCEAVRIKECAYNYTIDQLDKEDLKECFEGADMSYCPNCGAKMVEPQESEVDNG